MKDKNYKWMALSLLWVTYFLLQGTRQVCGATLPQIRLDFCVTDMQMGVVASAFFLAYAIAAEFKQTLEKAGLSVPKDVLLTGFADMPIATLTTPQLTTIRQNRDQMGGAAFRRLLERISSPDILANEILFPAPLVVRGSTQGRRRR